MDAQGVAHRLKCPACGMVLYEGEVFLYAPWWNKPWWFTLVAEVGFRLSGRKERVAILEYGEERSAARCPGCGGVWVVPRLTPSGITGY